VYIGCYDGNIYAYDASNGDQLWSATTGSYTYSSPAVVNGIVYIGSEDGKLYAYELNGGRNAIYKRDRRPPPLQSLQPNWQLKPVQG
jgi:outer membrane protein assembly factor BamB